LSPANADYARLLGGRVATSSRMKDLSEGIEIRANETVAQVTNLQSGEGRILFQSQHSSANGEVLDVPRLFVLAIPVFRDGPLYQIVARLRYRKQGAGIVWFYDLFRADER